MKKPNLLFFGIDSLRRDFMSMNGHKNLTTPHLDKYLSDALGFDNRYSPRNPTTAG